MRVIDASIFCLWLAFSPSIIQGRYWDNEIKELNRIAKEGGNISGVVEPLKDGCLAQGNFGLVYKGVHIRTKATLAMKFNAFDDSNNEIKVYRALGAYNDKVENIEAYGVPKVHCLNRWKDFSLIGISLLDLKFEKLIKRPGLLKKAGDILILFREVVRILKYIHGRHICHKDLNLRNIMFRKNQAFIIGYKQSTIFGSSEKRDAIECIKKDWRTILGEISISQFDTCIYWDGKDPINKWTSSLKVIRMDARVKKVFLELIKTVYEDPIPNYDGVYNSINKEIKNHFNGTAFVSWLKTKEKKEAKNFKIPSIGDIDFKPF